MGHDHHVSVSFVGKSKKSSAFKHDGHAMPHSRGGATLADEGNKDLMYWQVRPCPLCHGPCPCVHRCARPTVAGLGVHACQWDSSAKTQHTLPGPMRSCTPQSAQYSAWPPSPLSHTHTHKPSLHTHTHTHTHTHSSRNSMSSAAPPSTC